MLSSIFILLKKKKLFYSVLQHCSRRKTSIASATFFLWFCNYIIKKYMYMEKVRSVIHVAIACNIFERLCICKTMLIRLNNGFIILYLILCIIIWLTDFACCDWSIPGP